MPKVKQWEEKAIDRRPRYQSRIGIGESLFTGTLHTMSATINVALNLGLWGFSMGAD